MKTRIQAGRLAVLPAAAAMVLGAIAIPVAPAHAQLALDQIYLGWDFGNGFDSLQPLNTIDDESDAAIDFPNGALFAASANAIVIFSRDFFIRAIRNGRECRRAKDRAPCSP